MAAIADGSSPEEPLVLLHSDLDLWILEACNLPNMNMISERLHHFFTAYCPPSPSSCTRPCQPPHHHRHPKIITSDPYIIVSAVGATVASTRVIPKWNEHFRIPLAHRSLFIVFHIKDNDIFGAELISTVSIPAIHDWYPILDPSGKTPSQRLPFSSPSSIGMSMEIPSTSMASLGDPEKLGMRDTYFPIRKGGSVTLYQDAHVREGELPEIELEKGMNFEHNRYWEDICRAILEAHHLIYIIGWSVYDKVKLVREPTRPLPPGVENFTLGELLKYKSQEGVRVCLQV